MKSIKNKTKKPVFVGYLPKSVYRVDRSKKAGIGFSNKIVKEVASVSDCISSSPEGCIGLWKQMISGFMIRRRLR